MITGIINSTKFTYRAFALFVAVASAVLASRCFFRFSRGSSQPQVVIFMLQGCSGDSHAGVRVRVDTQCYQARPPRCLALLEVLENNNNKMVKKGGKLLFTKLTFFCSTEDASFSNQTTASRCSERV